MDIDNSRDLSALVTPFNSRPDMLLVPGILRPTLNGVIAEGTCSGLEKLRRPTTLFRGFPLNSVGGESHNDYYLDL